jgi:hypothetical protein
VVSTPLKNMKVCWDDEIPSQYDGKVIKFHGSSHHQPDVDHCGSMIHGSPVKIPTSARSMSSDLSRSTLDTNPPRAPGQSVPRRTETEVNQTCGEYLKHPQTNGFGGKYWISIPHIFAG